MTMCMYTLRMFSVLEAIHHKQHFLRASLETVNCVPILYRIHVETLSERKDTTFHEKQAPLTHSRELSEI